MSGYVFSGDKKLEQTFASEGSGAVRTLFCTLILHVKAIKQNAGVASLTVNFVKNSDYGEVRLDVISYDEDKKKGELNKVNPYWKIL